MGEAKFMVMKRRSRVRFLGASAIVLVGTVSTTANARCTTVGSTVTCDASAPNPERGGAFGQQVSLLTGAVVQLDDPFNGAGFRTSVVFIPSAGKLTTEAGSLVFGDRLAGVAALNNAFVDLGGSITVRQFTGDAVSIDAASTLRVRSTTTIDAALQNGFPGPVSAIAAHSGDNTIVVEGTVKAAGDGVYGLSDDGTRLFPNASGLVADVRSGGSVATSGSNAPAVRLAGGSTLTVGGTVAATGAGSYGVTYTTGSALPITISVLQGGFISAAQAPAIGGAADGFNNVVLTIAGSVKGGSGGPAVLLNNGSDRVTLITGADVTGLIDAGGGTDTLLLTGTGSGLLGATANFETLTVQSGNWTFAGSSSFSGGTTIAPGAVLNGAFTYLAGPIVNNGTLTLDQANDTTFTANVTGTGTLLKTGTGTLTVNALPGFTGTLNVAGGRLLAQGSLNNAVLVSSGATLGGNGTVGTTTVASGGRISPGASIGTLTIAGNLIQQSGSVYVAEINGAIADRLVINGTANLQTGAQLALTGTLGAIGTRYTLLSAAGGVTGTYAVTQQPANSLTELRLGYAANAVTADVVRTGLGLSATAQTGNQRGVTASIVAGGIANAAYGALVTQPSDDVVRAGLNTLSGEIHTSMRTAMVRDASLVRNTALDHAADGKDGPTLWAAGLASWGHDDGTPYGGGAAKTRRDTRGGLIGVGYSFGDIRVGLAGGYSRTKLTIDERASNARLKTVHVLGYATGQFGGLWLRATAGYSNVNGRSDRRVAIGSFSDRLRADADGNVLQGSAEAAMPFAVAAGEIAPFVGMEGYRTKSDAFAESGGAAALRAGKRVQSSAFSRSGLQVRTPLIGSISATASVAWVHRLAGEDPTTVVSFGGTDGFRTSGAPLSRNAADAALGIGWAASERFSLSASYRGTLGDKGDDSSVRAAATFRL